MPNYSMKAETGLLGKPKDPKLWIGKRVAVTKALRDAYPTSVGEFDAMAIGTVLRVYEPEPEIEAKPGVVVLWANGWENPWELDVLDIVE